MQLVPRTWSQMRSLPTPLLLASATGWVLLARQGTDVPISSLCQSAVRVDRSIATQFGAVLQVSETPALALSWLTMILAMMMLLLASPLLHVWGRSLRTYRLQAVVLFLLAYAAVWSVVGIGLAVVVVVLSTLGLVTGVPTFALAAGLALFWQTTPNKQICLNRCHSRPALAAFGMAATLDVIRYGLRHGRWCVGACWAIMLLPLAAGGPMHWPAMAAVTLGLMFERFRAPRAASWGSALPACLAPERTLASFNDFATASMHESP